MKRNCTHFSIDYESNKKNDIYVPNNEDNAKDTLLWPDHPKCTFSSKSFLKSLKVEAPSTSNAIGIDFPWSKFWKIKNIPQRIINVHVETLKLKSQTIWPGPFKIYIQ